MTSLEFFKKAIKEEKEIIELRGIRNKKIEKLKQECQQKIDEIERLHELKEKKREYCAFSDGWQCSFNGICTHKSEDTTIFNTYKCLVVDHAKEALKGEI